MARWVLHLDCDAFFASVEQLTRPTLRGRPVLVGGSGGRGVVAGASYEARRYGARSAMPMHQARRLVGAPAVVLPPRGAVYAVASRRVFDTVRAAVPVIEQLSFDEAFAEPAELVGADVAAVERFCAGLRAAVREATGLVASVGAGSGKQVAKIASGLAKPDGLRVVAPADERALLDPMSVRALWGIGPVAAERLARIGVATIGGLAALSVAEAADVLGAAQGAALHALANGVDDRPVLERAESKQISAEQTYPTDLVTLAQVREAVADVGGHAHRRLLRDGRAARTVTVKLRRADFAVLTRSATLDHAGSDAATLLGAARRLLLDPAGIGGVRLVGVGFSGLVSARQEVLFESPAEVDDTPAAEEMPVAAEAPGPRWRVGDDVRHRDAGHGWVQGAGHGVVTVRCETRAGGPGPARTWRADDPFLAPADPVDSLDWPSTPTGEDVDDV